MYKYLIMSTWCYQLLVAMVKSLQLLPYKLFHSSFSIPAPPLSEHKVLGIGELRETGMLIYLAWFVLRGRASCPACLHTLTCGHSGKHSHAHNDSTAAEKWCSRISNKSYYINKKLNKIIIFKNFNKKVLLRKHTYLSSLSRHLTKIGRIPDFIKSSMGGFLSLESSFLKKIECKKVNTRKHKEELVFIQKCFISYSPGCLYSTELYNRIIAGSVLQWTRAITDISITSQKLRWHCWYIWERIQYLLKGVNEINVPVEWHRA